MLPLGSARPILPSDKGVHLNVEENNQPVLAHISQAFLGNPKVPASANG